MKRLFVSIATIAVASASSLWAADAPKDPKAGEGRFTVTLQERPSEKAGSSAWGGGKTVAQYYIESIDKIVNLTDQQKKTITGIIEARDKATREFQARNVEKAKEATNAILEASKNKDKDAMAKAQEANRELYAPLYEMMKKSQQELDAVLTTEQAAKLQHSRATAWIKAMTDPVQLTDEQMNKAKDAYLRLTKAADQQGIWGKLAETIQSILTPEQKTTIFRHRAMTYVKSMFALANLTPEQIKQTEAAVDALGKEQNFKFYAEAYQKLNQKINALLTDEQKEAMKKIRSGWLVQPGLPAETKEVKPLNPAATKKSGEKKELEGKLIQLPGAVFQVIISEKGEVKEVKPAPGQPIEKMPKGLGLKVEKLPGGGLKYYLIEKAETKEVKPGQPAEETPKGIKVEKLPGGGIKVIISEKGDVKEVKPAPGQPAERTREGVKVRQIPGGVQVIIGEKAEANPGNSQDDARRALEKVRKSLEETMKSAKARMGDKVRRQHELAAQALQTYQTIQTLGEDKKVESQQLWDKLEKIEAELRRTFEPAAGGSFWQVKPGAMPGAPLSPGAPLPWGTPLPGQAWTPVVPNPPLMGGAANMPNREAMQQRLKQLREKADQLARQGKAWEEEAKRVQAETRQLLDALQRMDQQPGWQMTPPGQPMNLRIGTDPAVQELCNQVQDLRRQVEELKAIVKQAVEKKQP